MKWMIYLKGFTQNKQALHFLLLIRKASNSIMTLGRRTSIQTHASECNVGRIHFARLPSVGEGGRSHCVAAQWRDHARQWLTPTKAQVQCEAK